MQVQIFFCKLSALGQRGARSVDEQLTKMTFHEVQSLVLDPQGDQLRLLRQPALKNLNEVQIAQFIIPTDICCVLNKLQAHFKVSRRINELVKNRQRLAQHLELFEAMKNIKLFLLHLL